MSRTFAVELRESESGAITQEIIAECRGDKFTWRICEAMQLYANKPHAKSSYWWGTDDEVPVLLLKIWDGLA